MKIINHENGDQTQVTQNVNRTILINTNKNQHMILKRRIDYIEKVIFLYWSLFHLNTHKNSAQITCAYFQNYHNIRAE